MRDTGVVKRVKGDFAEVIADPGRECTECPISGSCTHSTLEEGQTIFVKNELGAEVNDLVIFEYEEREIEKGVFLVYGIPTLFILSGFILGVVLEKGFGFVLFKLQNAMIIIMTVLFLVASIFVVRWIDKKIRAGAYIVDILIKANKSQG